MTDRFLTQAVTDAGTGAAQTPSRPDRGVRVWDPLVRFIHWGLAAAVLTNALLDDPDSKLHEALGYVAVGLVALRVLWGLIGSRPFRSTRSPPCATLAT
jgi:cytochrome b